MTTPLPDTRPLETIREVKAHTFIFEKPRALPVDVCNEMIRRFEAHADEQYEGRIGQTVYKDRSIKRSTDLVVSGKDHWKDIDRALFNSLGRAMLELRETYPYFKGPFKTGNCVFGYFDLRHFVGIEAILKCILNYANVYI